MSNLKIAFNDIGQQAKVISSNRTFTKLHPLVALDSNNKSSYAMLSTPQSSCNIDYDLGELNATDITATASFLCFPSWFLISNNVYLQGANNSSFTGATTIVSITDATIQSNRRGFYNADYYTSFTESSAFRYFRVGLGDGSTSTDGNYSKFFFGNLFDLGVNPNDVRITNNIKDSRLLTDAGYSINVQVKPQKRTIVIDWVGVSNIKIQEFEESLFLRHNEPLIYLISDNAEYLSGVDVVSANIMNYEVSYNDDYNTLRVEFQEAL